MADNVSPETRSKTMRAVKSGDTKPELQVRSALFARGYRYRVHVKDLPGKPDLVFTRKRLAVFVHGCFWHGHGCSRSRMPATNVAYWSRKLQRNRGRDDANRHTLEDAGWSVYVVWECDLEADVRGLITALGPCRSG